MFRRSFLATGGLLLSSGCLSDSEPEPQPESEFFVTNERDVEIEVSIRLKEGERGFIINGFVLDTGETDQFTADLYNTDVRGSMSIAAKIINPQRMTYTQDEIPVGVPEYNISIQSDGISVTWVEE